MIQMIPIQLPTKMNSIELEFAWILEGMKRDEKIVDYTFEGITFHLADRTTYTPDFLVVYTDHFELVDIKTRGEAKKVRSGDGRVYTKRWSSKRDDAAVKIKVAAALFPWMKWAYYYKEANGRWTREEVGG